MASVEDQRQKLLRALTVERFTRVPNTHTGPVDGPQRQMMLAEMRDHLDAAGEVDYLAHRAALRRSSADRVHARQERSA